MIPEDADADVLPSEHDVREELPPSLGDGEGVNLTIPVYPAYSDEATLGYKPARSSDPEYHVKVYVGRTDNGQTQWGLWDPQDEDEEYLDHGVTAGGVGHGHFDRSKVATQIEEWLNELLVDKPEAVKGFKA